MKKDKARDKCTNKNSHTNPKNLNIYLFLALRLYLLLESVALGMKDLLFNKFRLKLGSTTKIFNNSLSKIIKYYDKTTSRYTNTSRGNSHSIRKASSTCPTSGTTLTLSLIFVALRG